MLRRRSSWPPGRGADRGDRPPPRHYPVAVVTSPANVLAGRCVVALTKDAVALTTTAPRATGLSDGGDGPAVDGDVRTDDRCGGIRDEVTDGFGDLFRWCETAIGDPAEGCHQDLAALIV